MNGLGFYLLVYGEPRHAVLVGNSAALMGRRDTELAQKAILVLWMQFSFLRFKLKEEPLTYTGIATQFWKAVFSKKLLSSTVTDMHFFQVVGVCHVVYCDDKKKKKCSSEYVMKDMSSSLHISDCILVAESHRVHTTKFHIGTNYMAKT